MSDVTLHINEEIDHDAREKLRDSLLKVDGVIAADVRDEKPHLVVIGYEPEDVDARKFLEVAKSLGLHGQLVGF